MNWVVAGYIVLGPLVVLGLLWWAFKSPGVNS